MVQARKIRLLQARPAATLLVIAVIIKQEFCLVPPAKGRARFKERCRVRSVKEVGARGLHALTVLDDRTGCL